MIDELERLRDMRSAVLPPTDSARLAAAEALAAAIAAAPMREAAREPEPEPRPSRRRRLRGRRVPAIVTVLAAATLAIVIDGTLQSGSPARPASAAAAVLLRLARVAAQQPASAVPAPGQYLYVDSADAYPSDTYTASGGHYSVLVPHHREIWIGPDDSGWLRETAGTATFLTPADRAAWIAAGRPSLGSGGGTSNTQFGPGCLSIGPTDESSLPTDPGALAADISERKVEGGPPGPAEDFVQIGDLLRETDASPALRAALYQVAARLSGVIALGPVTDHAGRRGVGLAYDSQGTRQELIFDPATSALLGEQYTVIGGAGAVEPPGTDVGWAVYLKTAIVDSLPSGAPDSRAEPITQTGSTSAGGARLPAPAPGSLARPCRSVSG
jgi:hypothetical protein